MKVVIVEDEPLSQDLLSNLLIEKYPHIEIVKILDSVSDCIDYFSKTTVDLIFMDIHLKDGNCFNIFEEVNISTPIIFTTFFDKSIIFDQYAIKTFGINEISYILKPLNEKKLSIAIDRFNQINKQKEDVESIQRLISMMDIEQSYKKRIIVKLGDRIIAVDENNVAYFIVEGGTCYLYTKDNNKYIVDSSLNTLSEELNPKFFFRVSRDCITTFDSIKNISKHYKGRLCILLTPEYKKSIIISQERVSDFMKWINGNN